MIRALRYFIEGRQIISYFGRDADLIPVLLRNGQVTLARWSMRELHRIMVAHGKLEKDFPMGGSVSVNRVRQGLFDEFKPRPVKVRAMDWMIYMDDSRKADPHWFPVPNGMAIQGMLVNVELESEKTPYTLVWLVTERASGYYSRWTDTIPRFVKITGGKDAR